MLRQAQHEEIWEGISADGIENIPHAELVEAPSMLIQPLSDAPSNSLTEGISEGIFYFSSGSRVALLR
jgi:hypothetical protein